ncbi:MAG: hypothetical protein E7K64_01585 [Clostridia bacterium]|nr:hypothetical protein [Clostridiales bacterium]MDU7471420.1 hypothetical protein [Serratia marcescens]MDU7504723.1 hypothetical protein [Clostridia bacterium]
MKTYEELMKELKQAQTDKKRQQIKEQLLALKTYNDAYIYNKKEMDRLS